MERSAIQRICNHASGKRRLLPRQHSSVETLLVLEAFKIYGRKHYEYVKETVENIRKELPALRQPYDEAVGVYPSRSFNLGPQTMSSPHKDVANLASSWCSITPIGKFDPKLGGHLVLEELGLVVEFPPSSTILIPSALITHHNIPVKDHETRFSIVQYAAGGLFRWAANGFMTDKTWHEKATADMKKQRKTDDTKRWGDFLNMFTMYNELIE